VLQAFKGRRVIQLPQSIHFADLQSNGATSAAIEGHGQFTMMVRDKPSAHFANTHYACPVIECPDLAFYLRALDRTLPSTDIVRLLRTDLERSSAQSAGLTAADAVDWLRDRRMALRVTRLRARLASLRTGRGSTRLAGYDRVAWHRIRRGCRLLSAGRVVITDRLHGHIMCTLLGIPHVALDNSYGKLGNFIARWTARSADLHTANTLADAERVAAQVLVRLGVR
jgi:pyruvyl transferase EpsO